MFRPVGRTTTPPPPWPPSHEVKIPAPRPPPFSLKLRSIFCTRTHCFFPIYPGRGLNNSFLTTGFRRTTRTARTRPTMWSRRTSGSSPWPWRTTTPSCRTGGRASNPRARALCTYLRKLGCVRHVFHVSSLTESWAGHVLHVSSLRVGQSTCFTHLR